MCACVCVCVCVKRVDVLSCYKGILLSREESTWSSNHPKNLHVCMCGWWWGESHLVVIEV
jgi:hypothetical protein